VLNIFQQYRLFKIFTDYCYFIIYKFESGGLNRGRKGSLAQTPCEALGLTEVACDSARGRRDSPRSFISCLFLGSAFRLMNGLYKKSLLHSKASNGCHSLRFFLPVPKCTSLPTIWSWLDQSLRWALVAVFTEIHQGKYCVRRNTLFLFLYI